MRLGDALKSESCAGKDASAVDGLDGSVLINAEITSKGVKFNFGNNGFEAPLKIAIKCLGGTIGGEVPAFLSNDASRLTEFEMDNATNYLKVGMSVSLADAYNTIPGTAISTSYSNCLLLNIMQCFFNENCHYQRRSHY